MKTIKKIFSLIIVLVILFSSNTTINLVAFGISNNDATSIEEKTEKESTEDVNKRITITGNWDKAEADGLVPPNRYFHEQVQKYIQSVKFNKDSNVSIERSVKYLPGKAPKNQTTDRGFIDLSKLDEKNGIAYYWEVKPGSHISHLNDGISQLSGYVDNTYLLEKINENRFGNTPYNDGKSAQIEGRISINELFEAFSIKPTFVNLLKSFDLDYIQNIDISFDCILDDTRQYAILISYMPSGIILYWFIRLKDDDSSRLNPEYTPDLSLFYFLFGMQFLNALLQFSASSGGGFETSGPSPLPAFDFVFSKANEIITYEAKNAFIEAYRTVTGSFSDSGKYSRKEQPNMPSDTYYIEEDDLNKLKLKVEAFTITSTLAAWVITNKTSIRDLEKVKTALLETIKRLIENRMTRIVIIGGTCYYMLDAADVQAIDNFKEYFTSYESCDPYSDEWDIDILTSDMLAQAKAKSEEMTDNIKNQSNNYEESQNQYQRDPLIINFSGIDEIEFTSLDEGVNFDLDNNGFAEKTAWIKNNDGFLAIDLNQNGKIDNGGELFGDCFIMTNGERSSNGFEALRSLDTNKNNKIDDNDSLFGSISVNQGEADKDYTLFDQLVVWFDNNHNGITDYGDEIKSLKELNVDYIDLNSFLDPYNSDNTNDNERSIRREETSYVYFKNGLSRRNISEFWFDVNTSSTVHDGEVTVGNVKTIEQALDDDETGELLNLCLSFNYADDIAQKHYYLKKILYFITDSTDIVINSRGGNIDARDLHVIEAFMGHDFMGVDGSNPNAPAAEMLKDIYKNIEESYYNILNLKMSFGGYISFVFDNEDEAGNSYLDATFLNEIIESKIDNNDYNGKILIYDFGVYLKLYDKIHETNEFSKYRDYYSSKSIEYTEIINLIGNINTFIGSKNDDTFLGSSKVDFIFGEEGNNTLYGSYANDRIYSGYGNDIMNGGPGDDSYYFGMYHGDDKVNDTEGNNKIVFIGGLSVDDYDTGISVSSNQIGFTLTNKETGDSVSLPDFLADPTNYEFVFEGSSQNENPLGNAEIVDGTDGDDYLEAGDGFNIFYGGEGDDTLAGGDDIDFMYGGEGNDLLLGRNGTNVMYGGAGNDIIYDGDDGSYLSGGDGDDMLYGGGGSDVLDGGAGNDYLQGDHGNDTYIFGKGYDVDTIAASSDLHTIVIHGYRASDMHNTREMNNDLVIDFGTDTGDRLILTRFFDYNSNRDYKFVFDDGTVLGQYDIEAVSAPINGTDGDDYLYGTNGADVLDGGAGNDSLNGGDGEDTYIFAKGYAQDTINEWGSDHSFVDLRDINSDEITVSDQWGSNLLISVNGTDDVLTVSNFKWGQATYTFRFADGAEGYVDKDTWQLVLTKQPDTTEEETPAYTSETKNAENESNFYEENGRASVSESEEIKIEQDLDEKTDDIESNLVA